MRPGRDGVHRHRLVAILAEQLDDRRQDGLLPNLASYDAGSIRYAGPAESGVS